MPPIYVKGGVWSNVEDEILKAAISKYGLNQWSRVSSLLAKKTAKQCKLRWQEWLSPQIRKLPWTREEDQRLLELARLRPNQWNSISLLMKRTSNQCIERYQQLLDDGLDGSDLRLTGNTAIGAVAGVETLNLNPESKPARPDMEEMDDDEREMLSEARARMANTQGKKAKRKARERLLAESRRVAVLQKRRELKQVGINTQLRVKKKFETQLDYNKDIVLERRPEEGRFSTAEEDTANRHEKERFDKKVDKNAASNPEVEKQRKKEKRKRDAAAKGPAESAAAAAAVTGVSDDESAELEFKKRRLVLSRPGEAEGSEDVDIDAEINEATKALHRATQERSVLFTKADEEEGEENSEVFVKKEPSVKLKKSSLKLKLSSLPKPLNDFEILVDEEFDEEPVKESSEKAVVAEQQDPVEQVTITRQSLAAQYNLPTPTPSPEPVDSKSSGSLMSAIESEMRRLVAAEAVPSENDSSLAQLEEVESRIAEELEGMEFAEYEAAVSKRSHSEDLDAGMLIQAIRAVSTDSQKLEKKLNSLVAEHLSKHEQLSKGISQKLLSLNELSREHALYSTISQDEDLVIDRRSVVLQESLDVLNEAVVSAERRL